MADKIVLSDVKSGFNIAVVNDNFSKIEKVVNDNLLWRDQRGISGDNALQSNIDVNSKRLYNLPAPISDFEAARKKDVDDALGGNSGMLGEMQELLDQAEQAVIDASDASRLTAGTATDGPLSVSIVGPAGSQVLNLTIPAGSGGSSSPGPFLRLDKTTSQDEVIGPSVNAIGINTVIAPGDTVTVDPTSELIIIGQPVDTPNIGLEIHAADSKSIPADNDELGLSDSAASWGLKKLTFANLKAVLLAYFKGEFREKLTAARTYYVRTDGSDANTGLSNTAGGAFLTVQKAVNMCAALDFNGLPVTVQVGDGTWTAPVAVTSTTNGVLTIAGNAATPDNVLWNLSSGSCITVTGPGVRVTVKDMKLQSSGVAGVVSSGRAYVAAENCTFGACGYAHVAGAGGGTIAVSTPCRIVGSAPSFANLDNADLDTTAVAFTLTGTPAFSNAFIAAQALSYARCVLPTFSGAATGARYYVTTNSVINVNGAGLTFLPGSNLGRKDSGGQYA